MTNPTFSLWCVPGIIGGEYDLSQDRLKYGHHGKLDLLNPYKVLYPPHLVQLQLPPGHNLLKFTKKEVKNNPRESKIDSLQDAETSRGTHTTF